MWLEFDMVEASTLDINTCTRALRACTSGEELALSGPIDCERSYQSAYGGQSCDASLRCGQAGTLGGMSIVAYGSVSTNCQILASGEPATCWCYSGQQSTSFEVDVDATDAWDVCSVASERCPDLVEVQIGNPGNYYYGPGFYGEVPLM